MVLRVEDENKVVIERGLQPESHALLRPDWIELDADVLDCRFRSGDAFDFAQDARAVVAERTREQLLFMLDGDFVGALSGREDGDDDANDGDGHHDATRDHDAQARATPTRVLPIL